jgi:CysZ protein
MIRIFQALLKSVLDLFHPRMLMLMLLPPLGALILWGSIGYIFWDQLLIFSQSFGERFLFSQSIPPWVTEWFALTPGSVATALASLIAFLLILPLTILTSMLITSVVVMPIVLGYIGGKFPELEKRGKNALVGSTKNMIISSVIYLVLWVCSLPLWMIPGLSIALPLFLNGYLNYRLFAFDSLADFASPREIQVLLGRKRIDFLILGVTTAALVLVPPLFLILPIYSSLCFARYAILELKDLRSR